MTEFDFIAQYLAPLAGPEGLGLLDDAALLKLPTGKELVITQDTMVEGVHFPQGEWGAGTAEKLLRVNLSDLAAKAATPWGYFLSLSLPKDMDERWFAAFAKGLEAGQQAFDWHLMGGDTTRTEGPLVISLTAIGTVPRGKMVRRSGAKPGDLLYVTASIGDASLGLDLALGRKVTPLTGEAIHVWEEAYQRPEPRLLLRKVLREFASAALDVSDGLIADAGHLAKASKVQLEIELERIPFSKPAQDWVEAQHNKLAAKKRLVTAGDDYEILCAVDRQNSFEFESAAQALGVSVTCIGQATKGEGVICLDAKKMPITFDQTGYRHF